MARILIVEDNDLLNQAYSIMLSHKGHTTMSAFDGKQGLEKAAEFEPDIILLDYLMPVVDGREFLVRYKPSEHPEVKVLLLTNLDQQEKIKEALALGAYRYLLKAQTEPHQLVEVVEGILYKTEK